MSFFLGIFVFISVFIPEARSSNFALSLLIRDQIEIDSPNYIVADTSIILPVSPGLDQEKSSLCWAFATLSLLESNIMLRYPQYTKVSFSRAFIQRNNAEERAIRSYVLLDEVFSERGTMTTALELINKYGLIPIDEKKYLADYADAIEDQLDRLTSNEEKLAQVRSIVDDVFFKAPAKVTFNNKVYTPLELAAFALNNQQWISYGFKVGAKGEWGVHPDPDAFKGTKAWYVSPTKKEAIILSSLQAGFPLTMFFGGHIIIVYGADYDSAGKALKYYLKDSYSNGSSFVYEAFPDYLYKIMVGLDTIDLRSKI
jgi:hypothetical protein